MTSSAAENALEEAGRLVSTDRIADYGHPLDNLGDIGRLWAVILGVDVSAQQVASCMVATKLARLKAGYHRDSVVDVAGYARVMELVRDEEERRALDLKRRTLPAEAPVPYPERCKEVGCEERRARPGKFCAEHEPPEPEPEPASDPVLEPGPRERCSELDCLDAKLYPFRFCSYHLDEWARSL
jgi:hypothetical protein